MTQFEGGRLPCVKQVNSPDRSTFDVVVSLVCGLVWERPEDLVPDVEVALRVHEDDVVDGPPATRAVVSAGALPDNLALAVGLAEELVQDDLEVNAPCACPGAGTGSRRRHELVDEGEPLSEELGTNIRSQRDRTEAPSASLMSEPTSSSRGRSGLSDPAPDPSTGWRSTGPCRSRCAASRTGGRCLPTSGCLKRASHRSCADHRRAHAVRPERTDPYRTACYFASRGLCGCASGLSRASRARRCARPHRRLAEAPPAQTPRITARSGTKLRRRRARTSAGERDSSWDRGGHSRVA